MVGADLEEGAPASGYDELRLIEQGGAGYASYLNHRARDRANGFTLRRDRLQDAIKQAKEGVQVSAEDAFHQNRRV